MSGAARARLLGAVEKQPEILEDASRWRVANGLSLRNPADDSAVPAPAAFLPSCFPREQFNLALQLQDDMSRLYARVARDPQFLIENLQSSCEQDDFTRRLVDVLKAVFDGRLDSVAPADLHIFRSDYMLHSSTDRSELKQVEVNCIAAGFSHLSHLTSQLHRHVLSTHSPSLLPALAPSEEPASACLGRGIAAAHAAYGVASAVILFVEEDVLINSYDVNGVKNGAVRAAKKNGTDLRIAHLKFTEADKHLRYDEGSRRLFLNEDGSPEVAVLYYRTCYSPIQYPTEREWHWRLVFERSRAVKCPSIALHLAGTKKIQQVLTRRDVLERFVDDPVARERMLGSFMPMLDAGSAETVQILRDNAEQYVLKPQREGGGNNIYGSDIIPFIESHSREELAAYVAQQRINIPTQPNYLMHNESSIRYEETVSELGTFGYVLAGGAAEKNGVLQMESKGYLLRTKPKNVSEGGIMAGAAYMDSVVFE